MDARQLLYATGVLLPPMIKPPRLRRGDLVAVVSPSSAVTQDLQGQFERGVAALESLGLRVRVEDHVMDRNYYSAGTAAARIDDLHRAWADPNVAMVLMSQGGQTANNLLDSLDYDLFRRQPKIFMCMSDGTTLLTAITSQSGIVTFHGPDLLFGFGRHMSEPFIDQFRSVVMDGACGPVLSPTFRTIRQGAATGLLYGGHVNILIDTMFAGFEPDLNGSILFLEGTHSIAELDRQFNALRLHGVFAQISGLILGYFDGHRLPDAVMNRAPADIIREITQSYDFPIIEIGELGHNVENFVLPVGIQSTIDTTRGSFRLNDAAVV